VAADDLVLSLGGCASNAAVSLAKLGFPARVCGRIGNDVFGRFVSETLTRAGVDVAGLKVDPHRATSQTLIINVRGEDRRFVHAFGANGGLSVADLETVVEPAPLILYVGGYLILPAIDPVALARRFAALRAQGTRIVLDVATPGKGDYLPLLRPVLPHTDVFLPNVDEAALILDETDPLRQAERFRELGARRVVITLGEEGAIAVSEELRFRLGVFPMPFVDASGGGDAFDAGYIAGMLQGLDELGCLTLASAVGASCVRAIGTTAGVFTRSEADAFLARHTLSVQPL
jgi:sugar/nucleoside kinase (ribokinase family)